MDAAEVIGSSEEPAAAVRAKPGSSMVTACRLVRDGSAEAVVSAGPTGAMLAASLLHVGRIRGISRPGIGVPLPAHGGPCLLIDSGANSDARAENLLQFGIMGSQFMRDVMGVERPNVGLLSIGEEPTQGQRGHGRGPRAAGGRRRACTSSATARAATCSPAGSTSSWPTGLPATCS